MPAWNIRFGISTTNWAAATKKPGLLRKAGLAVYYL
jgi:hypothetical protein